MHEPVDEDISLRQWVRVLRTLGQKKKQTKEHSLANGALEQSQEKLRAYWHRLENLPMPKLEQENEPLQLQINQICASPSLYEYRDSSSSSSLYVGIYF